MSGDRTVVNFRAEERDIDALEEIVEQSDEWGNRSAVMRGLIRQAAADTVAADGGPPKDDDEHRPSEDLLGAVYDAALTLVGHDHRLDADLTGAVAKVATNGDLTDLSPNEKTVRSVLERLQSQGFACYGSTVIEASEHTTYWRIKPVSAIPEKWRFHPDHVEQRRQQRSQRYSEQARRPVENRDEESALVNTEESPTGEQKTRRRAGMMHGID
jgi:hypothetical protein